MNANQLASLAKIKSNRIARAYYDTAIGLAKEQDINDVTVQVILSLTDTSRQTFYNYFANKNTLFNYVFVKDVNDSIYESNPLEVLTQIIPDELTKHFDYYAAISKGTGADCFSEFLTFYLQAYYQNISEKVWDETANNGIVDSTIDAYAAVSSNLFIRWLTDIKYSSQYSAKDVGWQIYKDIPASLYQAFDSPTVVSTEKIVTNIVNLGIGVLVGKDFLDKMFEAFIEEYPNIRINFVRSGHYRSVKSRSVGLELSSFEFSDTNYEKYKLCDHGIVMLVPKDNPLSKLTHAKLEVFYDENIVLNSYRDKKMLVKALRNENLRNSFSVNEISSSLNDIILENNRGVVLKSTLDDYKPSKKVQVVVIDDFMDGKNPFQADLNLFVQKEYELSDNERILARFLMEFSKNYNKAQSRSLVNRLKRRQKRDQNEES
ncbi:MAG: TetR family transcriptional regulator [Dehalococcoidales bacterium]|nr:TetR family transcriptional regulator [Dehalococcoidales bacterium]